MQTVLSLVARGVSHTVLPKSALRLWTWPQPLHVSTIYAPAIRNRIVLALPKARPSTRPSKLAARLLRALALQHYGGVGGTGAKEGR